MSQREVNPFEEKKRRRLTLEKDLPNFQVIKPEMPNKEMACYAVWKLRFEKHFPFLDEEHLIVAGHSLGAMFLVKYFSEQQFPFRFKQLHLVAPVFDAEGLPEGDNYLGDFAYEQKNIKNLAHQAEEIIIWHSKDDPVVPFHHSEKIKAELPDAKLMVFEEKQHFNQAEFPELIQSIQNA